MYVNIGKIKCKARTNKAALIVTSTKEIWITISQILSHLPENGDEIELIVSEWWAQKHGYGPNDN